ncbi:MAG: hypothetical protein WBD80_20900, partial [Xanthobacteraceae bacterium]
MKKGVNSNYRGHFSARRTTKPVRRAGHRRDLLSFYYKAICIVPQKPNAAGSARIKAQNYHGTFSHRQIIVLPWRQLHGL